MRAYICCSPKTCHFKLTDFPISCNTIVIVNVILNSLFLKKYVILSLSVSAKYLFKSCQLANNSK